MNIYKLLNEDAKSWWYHRQLRGYNNPADTKEARKRERESIRSDIKALRSAEMISIGRGGHTVYLPDGGWISGYDSIESNFIKVALHLKIPVIDTTTINDLAAMQLVRLPLPCLKNETPDCPPYGALSKCPWPKLWAYEKLLGATVYNVDLPEVDLNEFRANPKQDKLLAAFMRGDEATVGECLLDTE